MEDGHGMPVRQTYDISDFVLLSVVGRGVVPVAGFSGADTGNVEEATATARGHQATLVAGHWPSNGQSTERSV